MGDGEQEFLCHLTNNHEHAREYHRQGTVDEGAVYEDVYVEQMVLEDRDGDGCVEAKYGRGT